MLYTRDIEEKTTIANRAMEFLTKPDFILLDPKF
jgi:hypothetical protein